MKKMRLNWQRSTTLKKRKKLLMLNVKSISLMTKKKGVYTNTNLQVLFIHLYLLLLSEIYKYEENKKEKLKKYLLFMIFLHVLRNMKYLKILMNFVKNSDILLIMELKTL